MNSEPHREIEPPELSLRHLLFGLAVTAVGFVAMMGVMVLLQWLDLDPFAGNARSLGGLIFLIMVQGVVFQDRIESGYRFGSWCVIMAPAAAIVTILLVIVLMLASSWTDGDFRMDFMPFLASILVAHAAVVLFVIVAGRTIGPPEWTRRGTQNDGNAEEA